jgi:predicted histone-like DNA-binding protein
MSANYDFIKRPTSNEEEADKKLYVRLKSKGTIGFDQIVNDIVSMSGFSAGTIKGVIELYEQKAVHYTKEGYHVQLGQLGYICGKVKGRPVTNRSDIRSASVDVCDVNFRPSAWLKKSVHGEATRSPHRFAESQRLSESQRRELLNQYFQEHPYITREQYCQLTGLVKSTAMRELHKFIKEGSIDFEGRGTHKVFVKKRSV